jgi:hypothetical protein
MDGHRENKNFHRWHQAMQGSMQAEIFCLAGAEPAHRRTQGAFDLTVLGEAEAICLRNKAW